MKKVLLIEDNKEVRENTAEILELADYAVSTAENGKIGVELAKTTQPDLIICDIMMPELDGYGVLRILSRNPDTSSIPFIFLTAKTEKSDMRKGMNLGADDYITKPFEEDELLEAIETRMKKHQLWAKEFNGGMNGLEGFVNEARGLEELEELHLDRKHKVYRKKEVLYSEGDYANYLYFIDQGKVKTVKMDEYGKEFVIEIFSANSFMGYLGLMDDGEHQETAVAMEDTEVSMIPKQDFLNLIYKNRDVAARFIKILADNVQDKERRLLQLAYTPVRERVAEALLELQKREDKQSGEGCWMKISREDLANIVGTAKESLIRILSDFKKAGFVESSGTKIRVSNPDGLREVISAFNHQV